MDVLPGNDDEQMQEQPPGEQQGEVERAHAHGAVLLSHVRLNCDGGHHGNDVQKKNHVANEGIRRLMPQVNFYVRPHDLLDQPHP